MSIPSFQHGCSLSYYIKWGSMGQWSGGKFALQLERDKAIITLEIIRCDNSWMTGKGSEMRRDR